MRVSRQPHRQNNIHNLFGSRGSAVSIVTTRGWRARSSNTGRGKTSCLLQNVQAGCGLYLASYSMGTRVRDTRYRSFGVLLSINIHLAPKLGMKGAIPLLPLYAFIEWTAISLHFSYLYNLFICTNGIIINKNELWRIRGEEIATEFEILLGTLEGGTDDYNKKGIRLSILWAENWPLIVQTVITFIATFRTKCHTTRERP